MELIRAALKKDVSLSVWLLEAFSNQDSIKEFLIDCPIPDMKRFIAGLLKTAMNTVYKFEEPQIQEYISILDNNSGIVDYVQNT